MAKPKIPKQTPEEQAKQQKEFELKQLVERLHLIPTYIQIQCRR